MTIEKLSYFRAEFSVAARKTARPISDFLRLAFYLGWLLAPPLLEARSCELSPAESLAYVPAGLPRQLQQEAPITCLKNLAYYSGYDENRHNPAWVAYRLQLAQISGKHKRPSRFVTDERTLSRVSHDDYTKSGYSRGHLAPSASIFRSHGAEAMRETYYMSNIAPQLMSFNAGIWLRLEDLERDYLEKNIYDTVWVVTGPVYGRESRYLSSSDKKIVLPEAFYKILAGQKKQGSQLEILAWLIPAGTPRNGSLLHFVTSVDQIENLTAVDFFSQLPNQPIAEAVDPSWAWYLLAGGLY